MNTFTQTMTEKEYRGAFGLSQSSIKEFLRSPAHYLASTESVEEPTKAMLFGTAFHAYLLQKNPTDFVAVSKKFDLRKTDDKLAYAKFKEENEGKVIINEEEYQTILKMKENVLNHPVAGKILREATHREVAVFADYDFGQEHPKVQLKGLVDIYNENTGLTADLKTCEDASPEGFRRAIRDRMYDIQNVHYDYCLNKNGKIVGDFVFIAVEKAEPFAVACYRIDVNSLDWSRKVWTDAVADFCVCQETGNYPAYSEAVEVITL